MRALVTDPAEPAGFALAEVPAPTPGLRQVLVDVRQVSFNYGELHFLDRFPVGVVPGWDAAGVVSVAAAGGDGPAVGTPVVGYARDGGAWAQQCVFDLEEVAVVPEPVDLAAAAALPVAAVTALRALRAAGPLLGRRVLITGASGGTGRFAVQLAALGGAEVIASVGSSASGAGLAELGAHQVRVGLDGVTGPLDVVIDTVGGAQLVAAYALVAPGGSVQSVGWVCAEPAVFPPYSLVGPAKSITSFRVGAALGADLRTLLGLVRDGRLRVAIGLRAPWEKAAEAADALFGRQVMGKVVLDVSE